MIDPDIQGWYFRNRTSEAVRVRLSFADRSLVMHTLSDRLIAGWSLDELENREIPVLGERWSIGDRRVPDAYLVLECDNDYRGVAEHATGLRPVHARLWRALGFAAVEAGGPRGLPLLVVLVVAVVVALSQLF